MSLHRGEDDFSSLGGLDSLKAFTRRALLRRGDNQQVHPRGVMLLSPPGCGKSQFCKALGKEVGRPVLVLDVGSLMGSLVGQSEERTRQALATIDAMAPAIVMIDEVEKAFAGVSEPIDRRAEIPVGPGVGLDGNRRTTKPLGDDVPRGFSLAPGTSKDRHTGLPGEDVQGDQACPRGIT